jgi:hypothetical protein
MREKRHDLSARWIAATQPSVYPAECGLFILISWNDNMVPIPQATTHDRYSISRIIIVVMYLEAGQYRK